MRLPRTDDRARAARERFRADVSQLLEATLDPAATLDGVGKLAVPDLAELCVVDLLDAEGRVQGAGVASSMDAAAAERIRSIRSGTLLDPEGDHPVAVAARTGQVQFLPTIEDADLQRYAGGNLHHLAAMRELGYSSAIIVPLKARDRTLGILSLVHLGGKTYNRADLDVVIEVADHAALAIDNARLFAELRSVEAQQEAILAGMAQSVTAQDREGNLVFANQAAADALGAATPDELLEHWTADDLSERFTITDEHGHPIPLDAYPGSQVFAGIEPEPLLVHSIERETGVSRWTQITATPVHDAAGEVVMAVTVSDDVTLVKQAEAAQRFLASASKLLSASLDVETTLARAAATAVPALADWCRVDLLDAHGRLEPAALAHPEDAPPEHVALARAMPRVDPSDPRSSWNVVRSGRPLLFADVQRDFESPVGDARQRALAARLGVRSVAVVTPSPPWSRASTKSARHSAESIA